MRRDVKSLAVYGALVLGAILAAYAAYSWLSGKPAEKSHAAAPGAANGELAVDLTEKQVTAIKLGTVGSKSFVRELRAVGDIDFNQNMLVQVFTPYQGRIIGAHPQIGDKVEKDEVLFTIDSPDLLAAENNLITASGVFKLQNKTLARQQQMKSFGGASQQAVDQSTSDQMTAEGALKSARDAVRIFGKTAAEIDEIVAGRKADSHLVVKSPISGYVTARTAAPGLFAQPGVAPAPFTVADLSTMWMFANVPESQAPFMRVGLSVTARVDAYPDREFVGRIVMVGAAIDPNTRRLPVRSEIEDPQHLLRANMFANFVIKIGEASNSLAVPAAGVVREGDGGMSVWTTKDDRHFVRRSVKVGRVQDGYDEIAEGLSAGERVVTEGAVFLSNKLAGGQAD